MTVQAERPFYLFGMGNREKYIYRCGELIALSDKSVQLFDVAKETIVADRYEVQLQLRNGETVRLYENEVGVFKEQNGETTCLTASPICLPDFAGHPQEKLLRILHHEILFSIRDGVPYPNIMVYQKPWYRDGAMIAMVLRETGNLSLIKEWVLSLRECYDRNNKGNCEPDNIGQALFLISLVSDASHPLVATLTAEAKRLWNEGNGMLNGLVDYAPHPVYSAKWLKLGLSSLGLDSDWVTIPAVADDYSPLFWMAYRDEHVAIPRRPYDENYPYLWWAEQQFYGEPMAAERLALCYPVTNETNASEADYESIRLLSDAYADGRNASPHTWHGAEMFMYLINQGK